MEFSVLGAVRGWHNQQPVTLGGRQRRSVLAVLLLEAGQVVSLDRMVELIWGESPPVAVHNAVQTHVSRLRKALACDPELTIEARQPGYVLRVPPQRVDLHRFRRLVAQAGGAAETGDVERSGELLREALTQWQGCPLADVVSGGSLRRLSAGLEEERLAAVRQRLCVDLRLGRHAMVVDELADLVARFPTRESFAELWILALYRCGRQADALAEWRRIRARMVDELGIEPGPGLRALHQRILRADPALDLPAAPPQPGASAVASRAVPAQLPADVTGFCGRDGELAELDAVLLGEGDKGEECDKAVPGAAGTPVAVVTGTAGVGKTALAIRWAHRARRSFPHGQLYVDLRGYDQSRPMTAGEALGRLLVALGVASQNVPIEVDARASRFRTEIADRQMLIVLDNASSVEQVRALLPGTASCVVIVTSRDSLAGLVALHGARRLDLDPLSMDDATALLRSLIGERATTDPVATGQLAAQCARLPLALRVTAELAISRPGAPLARLADELRDGRRRLRLLDCGDAKAAVRTVLSWSYRHLPADAARLFRQLGCHPGPDFDLYSAAAMGGIDLDDAGRLLTVLARAHVIQPGPRDRYDMHDLLRAYATELAADDPGADTDPGAVRNRLFDYYLAAVGAATDVLCPVGPPRRLRVVASGAHLPPTENVARLRAWLDAERPNLVAICEYAATHGWQTHAVRLAATVYRYLEGGHYTDALNVHASGLSAARQVGDLSGEAHALTNLGLVHRLLGQYGEATEHLLRALELHRRTGDRNGEARTLSNLGIVEDRLGRPGSAVSWLDQALAHYRELGSRLGTAMVLTNLGGVCNGSGRYPLAVDHLTEALTLFRQLGDQGGEASALSNLGKAEMSLGQHSRAAAHLEDALAHFRAMNHRYGQAVALSNLGPVYSRLGRHDLAIEHLGEALAIFRDTGHRYGEASVLNGLGEALHEAGRPGALARHAAALELATETGDRDEQARAHTGAARVHRGGGAPRRACEHWQQALRLYTEVNSPQAEQIRAELAATDPTENAVNV